MVDLILISILCFIAWYWWDTSYCNELALRTCNRYCEKNGMQLLDQTITRQKVWLRTIGSFDIQICRLYSFEFTEGDDQRHFGYMLLLGHSVEETTREPH